MAEEMPVGGALKSLLARFHACRKEVSEEAVLKIISEVRLDACPTLLQAKLSNFLSSREYHRRFKENPPSERRKIAESIKSHADSLLKLLSGNPRFGLYLPSDEGIYSRIELVKGLTVLVSLASAEMRRSSACPKFKRRSIPKKYFEKNLIYPASDGAMDLIAWEIASIYEECFGKTAAISISTPAKEPGGPFVRFCRLCTSTPIAWRIVSNCPVIRSRRPWSEKSWLPGRDRAKNPQKQENRSELLPVSWTPRNGVS